ncbi:relaxin receptor 2-like [Ylistrum balloti]|uniref:relaxin receptor 2-like n=1 Tax=Ylistrum balloti TaxID=509963 RepID=UPI002905E5E9|nr:relaxin receptor 2-like [Ylistrum balloti]
MSSPIVQCVLIVVICSLATYNTIKVDNSDVVFSEENDKEIHRDFNKSTSFVVGRKSAIIRKKKRALIEECPTRSHQLYSCAPERFRQLEKYECCVYCPEQETGVVCEPYNCTESYICSSANQSSLHIDLDLRKRNLEILPHNVFSGLSELSHLYFHLSLSHNSITVLPNNVFSELSKLTHLNLAHNSITDLHNKVFSGLYKLSRLHLIYNNINVLPYNIFSDLSELTLLSLKNNKIKELPYNVFSGLSKLTHLYLNYNNINDLHHNVFNGLSKLTHLSLSHNNIEVLPHNVFRDLSALTHLHMKNNRITVLPSDVYSSLTNLNILSLSSNTINALPYNVFSQLSVLTHLYLEKNRLTVLPFNVFSELSRLTILSLPYNTITELPFNVFRGLSSLTYLHLSNNNISVLSHNVFGNLSKLVRLNLQNNKIAFISNDVFTVNHQPDNGSYVRSGMGSSLKHLDLANNLLTHLPYLPSSLSELNIIGNKLKVVQNIFEGLDNLSKIYTDTPFMCCAKPPSVDEDSCVETHHPLWFCVRNPDKCKSEGDAISSCYALISSTVLRACLWIIGISALIGNVVVLFYRCFMDRDNITKSYSLFTLNLAMSDLLMGIYLFIIGVVDAHYNGIYAWNDQDWRSSILCTTAGVLSSVSSEMSTFLILLVTVDRLIVILFPLSRLSRWSFSWIQSLVVSVFLWIVSVTLAIIPIVYFKGQFYSQSSVCLALPLTGEERPGTQYSFAVFVCLNSAVFLVIVIGQISICKSVRESGRRISLPQNRQREMAVVRTLFFVVMTDFCCWFPIGVMGVASKCGVEIPDGVYAWVMVFVLPINAAINPFLYTALAVWRRRRQQKTLTTMTSRIPIQSQPPASRD